MAVTTYEITQAEANARANSFTGTSYTDSISHLEIDDTDSDCFGLVFQDIDTSVIDTFLSATLRLTFQYKQGADTSFDIEVRKEDVDDADLFVDGASTGTTSIAGKNYESGYTDRKRYVSSNDYAVDETIDIDVSTVFTEITARGGWASGNDLGMLVSSVSLGYRMRFYSYDNDPDKSPQLILNYASTSATEETYIVGQNNADAYEDNSTTQLSETKLRLGGYNTPAFLFENITIDKDTQINFATLRYYVTAKDGSDTSTSHQLQIEDDVNPSVFDGSTHTPRGLTVVSGLGTYYGINHVTIPTSEWQEIDATEFIQYHLDRASFASGNNLVLRLYPTLGSYTGNNYIDIEAYEAGGGHPVELIINYEGGGEPPVATFTPRVIMF